MKKDRLFYLDFIRAIAAISIVITHFNAVYLYMDPPLPMKAVITSTVSNIYIGNWGVSLFFIISGASLMYVYEEHINLKTYFEKRFFSIYPMFWMAYGFGFLYLFYKYKSIFAGAGIPKFNFIYTILGLDGFLLEEIPTYYILGEWFLGTIIMIYIVFPIIRKLINNKPLLLWIGILIIYVYMIWFYEFDFNKAKLLTTRLPELVFGMYFVKKRMRVKPLPAIFAFLIILINWILKPNFDDSLQTTYIGISSFIVLVFISYYFENRFTRFFSSKVSKYSYPIFLVHHVIISQMMATFDLVNISILYSYILFAAICIVICFISWALFKFHKYVMLQLKVLLE